MYIQAYHVVDTYRVGVWFLDVFCTQRTYSLTSNPAPTSQAIVGQKAPLCSDLGVVLEVQNIKSQHETIWKP